VEHFKTELHSPKIGIPTLWWRSVGHTANAYVMETFIDQMAAEAGQDPIEYRRKLLPKDSRRRGALELAVEKAGPFEKSPGRGRGVAVHESFASYVAQVVDVSVKDGKTKIEKIVCAVDCGIVINPDQVKAQMQSGILYGLSAALGEAITLKDGVVQQSNFDSYPVLRMPATPPIEVYLVESNAPPTGTGEPGTPVIAPALANAYQQATGKRLTQLPLSI
jgi:isoquinoline 1-oxidoreductase beta subunit